MSESKRPSVKGKKTARSAKRVSPAASAPLPPQGAAPADTPSSPSVPSIPSAPSDFFDLGDDSHGGVLHGAAARPTAGRSAQKGSKRAEKRARAAFGTDRENDATSRAKGTKPPRSEKPAKPKRPRRIVPIAIGIATALALAAGAFFCWNTFFRYDDAADIQGEWRTQDNSMTVVIDGESIRMPELEYPYELDVRSKIIEFSFSNLTGSGTYAFSGDRLTLTIVEGEGDAASTTVLVKVSNDTQAEPALLGGEAATGDDAEGEGSGESGATDAAAEDGSEDGGAADAGEGAGEGVPSDGDAAAGDGE